VEVVKYKWDCERGGGVQKRDVLELQICTSLGICVTKTLRVGVISRWNV